MLDYNILLKVVLMDHTTEIINHVFPILFLIFLGQWIRRRNFLAEGTIEDLRKIAVNLALLAVLFTSFLQIQLKSAYYGKINDSF